MLNDLKDWAIEKADEAKGTAEGVVNEVQTTSVMDWSLTVWVVIGVAVLIMAIGILSHD